MWTYNPFTGQLVFVMVQPKTYTPDGMVEFGQGTTGDISVDTGQRTNEASVMDNGSRVVAE